MWINTEKIVNLTNKWLSDFIDFILYIHIYIIVLYIVLYYYVIYYVSMTSAEY